jgi:2-amino-4-hydroxy-6-hydroxymethyldihydropteridine diphosphokinase
VPKSDQPLFRNAVFSAVTDANPLQLLERLNDIEARIGRVRTTRNAARVLDLDILDFNAQLVDLENLTIPHPRMHLRAFVLIPLQEIRADYIHPVTKKPIISLINDLPDEQEISRLLG